jgi:hypothetical protein
VAEFSGDDIWQDEDADWERLQREGLAALAEHDITAATKRFAEALRLARQHFQPGDPRLATSLANQALLLALGNDPAGATLFREALFHWDRSRDWLALQPRQSRRARSSLFHLRLEAKHPGAYGDRRHRQDLSRLAEGRDITQALAVESLRTRGKDWQPTPFLDTSPGFSTQRKIAAAVQLIARTSGRS